MNRIRIIVGTVKQSHQPLPLARSSMAFRTVLLGLLLSVFTAKGYGQVFDFRTFGTREGLISNSVSALCEDSSGYLWVGSGDGISVFDGETATNYSIANGLSSTFVNVMVADSRRKGVIWIGTNGGGLIEFHGGRFTNYRLGNTDWSERVNSITEGAKGTIFLGTDDGIFSVEHGRASRFSDWRDTNSVDEVVSDGDSLLVLDGNGLLSAIVRRTNRVYEVAGKFNFGSPVAFYCFDSRNRLWVSLDNGTLLEIADGSVKKGEFPAPAQFLISDRYDNIWLGTSVGVFKFQESEMGKQPAKLLSKANGLPENVMTSAIIDDEGDIWFGTSAHGICELSDQNACSFALKYSDIALNNSEGAGDWRGHIWTVDDSSLTEVWRRRSGLFEERSHPFKLLGVRGVDASIHITGGDKLWLCSSRGIIREFDILPGKSGTSRLTLERSYYVNRLFHHIAPLCFWVDSEKRIWYSLAGVGVLEFDARSGLRNVRVYDMKRVFSENSVRAIFEDSHGNVWFGDYIGGLAELPSTLIRRDIRLYTTRDGLPDNSVRAIVEDDSGNLWIGTRYGGVAVFRNGKFRTISVNNGLISDGVWAEAYNEKYGVLFATQGGLQLLGDWDGLPGSWHRFGDRTISFSCGITSSDLLWGFNGARLFVTDLTGERSSGIRPGIHVTKVYVNGNETVASSLLGLPYNKNTITFDFSGVSLRDERTLTYRYMLRGADANWRFPAKARSVTYVSLKPGKYTFEVCAVKPSGIMSAVAEVPVSIIPPVWDRWWFLVLAGLAIIAIIYSGIKIRVNRILEIGRVRSRIAADLHDEIGSGLTRIAMLADYASERAVEKSPEHTTESDEEDHALSARRTTQKIGSHARDLIDSMSDVIWSIDPKYDSLDDFVFYFRTYANELTEAKGITLEIETGELGKVKIGPQVKRSLQLVSKEALTNSVKYSGCSKVKYRLTLLNRRVCVSIEDDGSGFDIDSLERGHGLNNMERHAREMHGELTIRSSPGHGTRIIFSFPIS